MHSQLVFLIQLKQFSNNNITDLNVLQEKMSYKNYLNKYTDNNCETGYISFDTSLDKYHKSRNVNNNKLNTPESFIKYMLDKPKSHTTFKLIKNNNDKLKNDRSK